MMRYILLFAGMVMSAAPQGAFGQVPTPRPAATPSPLPSFQKIFDEARIGAVPPGNRDARRANRDFSEARRQAKKNMEPDEAIALEFSKLVDSLDAQMIRLHPDFGCESKLTLSVDANCSGRVIGASRFEGLHYDKGRLVGDRYFTIFMIADIGEVEFEDVDRQNAKVKLVSSIVPPTEFAATKAMYEKLAGSGITVDDLHVSDRIEAKAGMTFVVRSVAYKASGFRIFGSQTPQVPWELRARSYSGRWHDELFAAKVVRRSEDGTIHLFWRRIIRKPAPTIRFAEDSVPTDFRPKRI